MNNSLMEIAAQIKEKELNISGYAGLSGITRLIQIENYFEELTLWGVL